MHPETGVTIIRILERRIPYEPTALLTTDGETLIVQSFQGPGRDLGDEFDHFMINIDEADSEPNSFLYTNDIAQIIDPTTGLVIFEADRSDNRMPSKQIKPFGGRKS